MLSGEQYCDGDVPADNAVMWFGDRNLSAGAIDRKSVRTRSRVLAACLLQALAIAGSAAGQPTELEGRAYLLDLAARAEVDGFARLDELTTRSAALPTVFDPVAFSGQGANDLRAAIQEHLIWLESAKAEHLFRIESLPGEMRAVRTSEPYTDELISDIAEITPERARLVAACYDGERAAADTQLAFLQFVERSDVRIDANGFTFVTDEDVVAYTGYVADVNQAFEAQNLRMDRYYAWELRQKAQLQQYRNRL
jgi:hypothetical protein